MTEQASEKSEPTVDLTGKVETCIELLDQVLEGLQNKPIEQDDSRAKSFGEAYDNGYRDGLQNHLGWIIDMRGYIEKCTTLVELTKFKKNFLMFMNENIKKIDRDPTGLPFDDDTMYIVESEPTDDSEKVGTVLATSVMFYYRAGDYVVRKQPVKVYSDGEAGDETQTVIPVPQKTDVNSEDQQTGVNDGDSDGNDKNSAIQPMEENKSPGEDLCTPNNNLQPEPSEIQTQQSGTSEDDGHIERIGADETNDEEPVDGSEDLRNQLDQGDDKVEAQKTTKDTEDTEAKDSYPRGVLYIKKSFKIIFKTR